MADETHMTVAELLDLASRLATENERLRAREAALVEIAEEVARDWRWVLMPAEGDRRYCMWCGHAELGHQAYCPVSKARALLAQHGEEPAS